MKQYNYKPDREIPTDRVIIASLMIIIICLVLAVIFGHNCPDEYSRHACKVTTGDQKCNQQ